MLNFLNHLGNESSLWNLIVVISIVGFIIIIIIIIVVVVIIIIINTLFEFGKIYIALQKIYGLIYTN